MSKSETIMAGAKRLLVTSLAAMFAGLTTSAKANGFKAKRAMITDATVALKNFTRT